MNKWDNIQKKLLIVVLILVLVFGLIPSLFKLLIAADIISYDEELIHQKLNLDTKGVIPVEI